MYISVGIGQKGGSGIGFVEGVDFGIAEPGIDLSGEVKMPGIRFAVGGLVFFPRTEKSGIGILAIASIAVPLPVEIKTPQTGCREREPPYQVGCGQTISELDSL